MATSNIKERFWTGGVAATGGVILQASVTRNTVAQVDGATVVSRDLASSSAIVLECNVTAQSGTTPTLDCAVECSLDGGTNWFIIARFSQFAAVTGIKQIKLYHTATFATEVAPTAAPSVGTGLLVNNFEWDHHWRVSTNVGGTGPSFTLSVRALPFLSS